MTYGLTASGFQRKLFSQIKSEQEDALTRALGELNFSPPSTISQIVAILSEREAVIWELAEAVYNSSYPNTAEDYSLDGVCSLTGVNRLSATYTRALCQLTAVNYTTVPKSSEALVKNTNNVFSLEEEIVITNENCYGLTLEIANNSLSSYSVIINGISYTYYKADLEFIGDIAHGLATIIAEGNPKLNIKNNEEFIFVGSKSVLDTFSCFVTEEINIVDCTNNAYFVSNIAGEIAAPSNSVSTIQTPIQGWVSVNNLTAGVVGRNLETDVELRNRRNNSLALSGSGTLEAMRARISNLTGVMSVSIRENATSGTDSNNIPPHSFETLVLGGDDLEIGQTIWLVKPIGIGPVGNTEIVIKDSTGEPQLIKFSRSTKVYIYVAVKITKNDAFIEAGTKREAALDQIKNDITTKINKLGLGNSIIYQSLLPSVYSLNGINFAEIKIGKTLVETTVPTLLAKNMDIEISQIAVTDISKITVEVV